MNFAVLLILQNCAISGSGPTGILATSTTIAVYADSKPGPKMGRACIDSYLGVYAKGDASLLTAKRSGGLQNIATVDQENLSLLGLYARLCTVVTGS